MTDCQTPKIERRGPATWVWMNRPDMYHAFDETLIWELAEAFPVLDADATDLIRAVARRPADDAVVEHTARRIATVRATPEAKEGLGAFLEQRPAAWVPVKG